jgi:ADP-ribose pyrophosphatase
MGGPDRHDAREHWTRLHASPLAGVRPPGPEYVLRDVRVAYAGRIFQVFRNLIRLPNGFEAEHEILLPRAAVSVIPLLEDDPDRPEVVLVEQFRSTVEGYIHEIPAGILEPGEDPLDCAGRELLEETGYSAKSITAVATILPTPGIALERMHYFLARGLTLTHDLNLDPGECLHVRRFPLQGLLESMVLGRPVPGIPPIVDGKTCIGLFYLGALRGLLAGGSGGLGPAAGEVRR